MPAKQQKKQVRIEEKTRHLPSASIPPLRLRPRDIEHLMEELQEYHDVFFPLFQRREQGEWSLQYLQGLLLDMHGKSVEPMALALPGGNVRAMQQFLGQGAWDDRALLRQHWVLVQKSLGEEDGVLIVDGSDFPKQGKDSVGVARQWCGARGKVDNCQAGVFLAYASSKGATLLDRRLYLPETWLTDEYAERRKKCGVPEGLQHRTQPDLAWDMVEEVLRSKSLSARWVTFDEHFGQNPSLLDRVASQGLWYLAEVPVSTRVWLQRPETYVPPRTGRGRAATKVRVCPGEPRPIRVDALARTLSGAQRQRLFVKEGEKGVQKADFAAVRAVAVRDGLPGPDVWVLCKWALGGQGELKVFLSNTPADMPLKILAKLSGIRWPIETCFRESKQELGMDQYQTRSWLGWHHHMTLVILAHHFLVRMKLKLKKARRH